jgi:small-conductance mechanosensitive channel
VTTLVHYTVLLVGFLLAFAAMGLDLNRFTILAGAFGVGIGFGMQNIVNNFVSGLILLFERPIQVGDTVQMGELVGEITRIGIRSSAVRTWQGAEVIVPNASFISEAVTNWTLSDRMRRIEIKVGVAYGTDPERVLELLSKVAADHPLVLTEPAAVALFLGFGDSALDFELRVWTNRFEQWVRIRSELNVAVNAALRDADITIPFPQRDVHIIEPKK